MHVTAADTPRRRISAVTRAPPAPAPGVHGTVHTAAAVTQIGCSRQEAAHGRTRAPAAPVPGGGAQGRIGAGRWTAAAGTDGDGGCTRPGTALKRIAGGRL